MRPWRVLSSRLLLERKWLTLREQRVMLPTGVEIDEFHLIESPDWVGVLALDAGGAAVVVEQYRHGAKRAALELPAGVIDEGESPLDAARRELREETGYEAAVWTPLITVSPEPARHTNLAHFFVATEAERVADPSLDEAEHLAVRLLEVDALIAAITSGELIHGSHVGAILLAARRGLI